MAGLATILRAAEVPDLGLSTALAYGAAVALVSTIPAFVTGLVKRLVGAKTERINLRRVVAWAVGAPLAAGIPLMALAAVFR